MKISADVKRVIAQIVEASCNSMSRMVASRCRQMILDEGRGDYPAHYVDGYNDAMRTMAKWLDGRIEQSLVEAVARDAAALVEVGRG